MDNNWKDQYILDIKNIDDQHRGFFKLWDEKCKNANYHNTSELEDIIEALENYIKGHFSYEEKLLDIVGYEDIDFHVEQHNYFIIKVDEMKHEMEYMNPMLFQKTANFLKRWFLSHIMQSDKAYTSTVKDYQSHINEQ